MRLGCEAMEGGELCLYRMVKKRNTDAGVVGWLDLAIRRCEV